MATQSTTGDPMVRATQMWLNRTYGNDSRFNVIPDSVLGKTGWTTIYALIRALQIELGIQNTADNFGPTTQNLFETITREDGVCKNVFGIVQGALWCKGYDCGHYGILIDGEYYIDPVFDASVENAVKALEADAGRTTPTGQVDLNLMKALLSMDAFKRVLGGSLDIRDIQQYLNKNYESYIGLRPCDGIYGRGTNKALIFALQAEEGLPTSVANGNFGQTTKRCCPTIPYNNVEKNYNNSTYSTTSITKFTKLIQMGLFVNGFGDSNFDGVYDEDLETIIKDFQEHYALTSNGIVNLSTWLSLLISCGDTSRSALACDCATILTQAKANTLYSNGYRYVGRYLSGTVAGGASKALSRSELQIAFDAGLRIFPIYQSGATSVSYFTESKAYSDAENALYYANKLGIPTGTIIYFAVDCDPIDTEISSHIIPYFHILYDLMKTYKVGIYGTRNVCTRVSSLGYAEKSFVSDMSTGFSGNLGFIIPENWAFDQFTTVTVGTGEGMIEIDKDGYSGRDSGINSMMAEPLYRIVDNLEKLYDKAMIYTNNNRTLSNMLVLQYIRKDKYNGILWNNAAGEIDEDFCDLIDTTYPNLNFTFYDPVNEENNIRVKYDIPHFAATLNALLFDCGGEEQPGLDVLSDLYAGWAGDVLSFTSDIENAKDDGETDLLQWAKDNICTSNSKFSLTDYIADIDALNIANMINEGSTLPAAFILYFTDDTLSDEPADAKSRTSKWINNVGTYYLDDTFELLEEDELRVFAYLLAQSDMVTLEHISIALAAFKYYVYNEQINGR